MAFDIRRDDLTSPDIAALLEAHLAFAAVHSPRESIHALDLARLRVPSITFWSAWDGETLVGCAALRELSPTHGEIKSMHTVAAHRGRGVARALLGHILDEARARHYERVSLETGSTPGFEPARSLYTRAGFVPCPPFADYREDAHSLCMTLVVAARPEAR